MANKKSIKKNTIANFIGLGYTTAISIVILPLYLRYLGAEAFGLVGFFAVLQAWMQLLDMGMSPLLSREAAKASAHNDHFLEFKKLLRSLEFVFFIISVMVFSSIVYASDWISNNWLQITSLSITDVSFCMILMGGMVGLRFFASLYRSGIRGLENQVRLNIANIFLVSLKFVGALAFLHFVSQDFVEFFIYQLIVGIVELLVMLSLFYSLIPTTKKVVIGFYWKTFKPVLPFAGGIAYTAGIWILLTQLDKLILTRLLSLSEYGYFALVVVVANGITQLSGPISQAILPRMTYLLSEDKEQEMLALYRKSTQIMAVLMLPLTGMIALFSTELLFAWTGDRKAAEWAGPILYWFALGNGILAISSFQYYLQFAHGKLKMHVIYNTISVSIQVPIIIYVAYKYGAIGVALTWFSLRVITFFIWTPIVHHKFAPGIHWKWLFKDVAPILITTFTLLYLINQQNIVFDLMNRFEVLLTLIALGLVVLITNIFVSSVGRKFIFSGIKKVIS